MKKRTGRINQAELSTEIYPSFSAEELMTRFLAEKQAENLSEQTLLVYRFHCNMYLRTLQNSGVPAYKTCTKIHYNQFIVDQQNQGKKDITIAAICRSIRAWFYWMMANNYIAPFQVIIPRFQKTIPETYTDEELERLLQKPNRGCTEVEYETWVFVNLAIGTGLRLSSMLNLKVSDNMH